VLDSRLGNHEKLALYAEALEKFTEAKQLPELFRSIFRSAYLPYKSPETLGLFLKEMNHFDYTHPEELGNAYEYLLSIMSSQGDAGQFRTPRHIIDFMVDVVNPSKDDRILDPACGTGGFLISSYKHILEQHDGKNDPKKKEKPLTPDDRKKLMANLEGYDIDPTMVRIAQVNMYLHQFKSPQIFQYDTLTSEERWNDKYDVILANPPFMSPRGGIRPHNKFGVTSNRAEVLFVDYIINHLKPKGRAGIIVPEGIIFQSGNAYKALRKALVENGLYAVVSLPGGVFQPYSGVKTSILLFDNEFSKHESDIAFVKISADGFDLGATKRVVSQNDLPEALEQLKSWVLGEKSESSILSIVSKSELASKGNYNLSAGRYKVGADYSLMKWPIVTLEDVATVRKGSSITQKDTEEGSVPVVAGGQKPAYFHNESNRTGEVITVSASGAYAGFVNYFDIPIFASDCSTIQSNDEEKALTRYLYFVLKGIQDDIYKFQQGGGQPHVYPKDLITLEIPLPPLEVQRALVAELEGYAAIIIGARQIVDIWKPRIEVEPQWPVYKLSDLCELITKGTTPTSVGFNFTDFGINFIKIESITGNGQFIPSKFAHISENCHDSLSRSQLKEGDVLFSIAGALGRTAVVPSDILPANTNQALAILRLKSDAKVLPQFLEYLLLTDVANVQSAQSTTGVAQQNISLGQLGEYLLPVPPTEVQIVLVEEVKREEAFVQGSALLAKQYEKRTQDVIAKLWNASEEVE
jgi:type I restriction enzyme M protein